MKRIEHLEEKLKHRFELIKHFYLTNKRMPSYSEMAELFSFKSKNAVFKTVNKLIDLGFLIKDEKGRLRFSSDPWSIRLIGSVKAGFPSFAEEELLDTVSLDRFLIDNPDSTFMLKVSGDSMIDAGIMPNDYVIVDRAKKAKNNDIVIAQVDGEWTMKYLRHTKEGYLLVAANDKYKPIKPKDELVIAGVVISVVRKYR